MRKLLWVLPLLIFAFVLSCTPKTGEKTAATAVPAQPAEPAHLKEMGKPVVGEEEDKPLESTLLEGPEITLKSDADNADSLRPYNASHTFEHDLLHTKIEISFDWAQKRANGKTTLTMRPWFYATDKVTLDAKNFDIKSVTFDGKTEQLKYDYNNEQITVRLGRMFARTEEFKLTIVYTAKPDEREAGGSAAITSDKGLYFINADGKDLEKPRQIWTQGETESNSCWFPTVDKPNERCTQEIYMTVEDKYKTLSNGLLISSKKNADGTRTDYWKMDKPHAPYLTMMAVGEFAVVKDKWRNIELDYYVEPKFEQYAKDIFAHTPEIMEMFSTKLNYPYPWQKFSQVVVRDYVSGAMENTTAVIFGDYVQKTKRELLDDHLTNEKVVAHEMFHHWFGDLVTCESWSNLTMNEGFANYSEYLWMEHKHGRDAADHHLMQEQRGFLFSAEDGGHPLIHYGYDNREDMFDAHSYNKGGCVLHMLRHLTGDEAFFAALNRYLKKNEYTDVEADELRLAFEDVTGQDWNWFFDQWFFGEGFPELTIDYAWDETAKQTKVTIKQNQKENQPESPAVFNVPLNVDVYDASGKARRETIRLTKREQTFSFASTSRPTLVNVDADRTLLSRTTDNHTAEEWIFMFKNAPRFMDRWAALDGLENDGSPAARQVFELALQDKFWAIREKALEKVDLKSSVVLAQVVKIAESDSNPGTRAAAIGLLADTGDKQYIELAKKGMGPDQAFSVLGASLNALTKLDPPSAIEASKSLENETSEAVIVTLAGLYAQSPNRAQLPWFQKKAEKVDFMGALNFFEQYQLFLIGLNDAALLDQSVAGWQKMALDLTTSSPFRRFAGTKTIADVRNHFREQGNKTKVAELEKLLEEIKAKETDETLKLYYGMF